MARKIILHIGAGKTGSSAIQSFLRANQSFFRSQRLVIPDSLLGLSARVTGEHVMTLQNMLSDPDTSRLKTAMINLRDKPDPEQTILISAENLSNPGMHALIAPALEGFDAKVILYIRRQDELLTSAWQQWHSKTEGDFNAWLIKGLRYYGLWDRMIANWQGVVGTENVQVRVFDRDDMVEGDLLRDFLAALGLDPKTNDPIFDQGTINPSYNDMITELVAGNTALFEGPHDSAFYHMVGRLTGDTYVKGQKISLLSRAQRESVLYYYRDINQRVCKEHFPGRPALFSALDHSKYQYLKTEEMLDRQLKFLTHLIFELNQKQVGRT